jgi:hypothetical protein
MQGGAGSRHLPEPAAGRTRLEHGISNRYEILIYTLLKSDIFQVFFTR